MIQDIEDCLPKELGLIQDIIHNAPYPSKREFHIKTAQLCRQHRLILPKDKILESYWKFRSQGIIPECPDIERYSIKLSVRSHSGIVVVTIVLKPFDKSCTFDCDYCADERISNGADFDVPRSYHSSEPAVRRAFEFQYDIMKQLWGRLEMLRVMGHPLDKVEIILLGGTFSVYERKYQEQVFLDLFYGANMWDSFIQSQDKQSILLERKPLSLEEEQTINQNASVRLIGIVVETRPDCITNQELMRYRNYGVTRVQIGVQHTDDDILAGVNRRHGVRESIQAIRLLKNWGFKVDIHIMPDLPGTTPEKDIEMFQKVLESSDFCADYMKIYPCLDVKFSRIREWKETGKWKPYAEENKGETIIQVLTYAKERIPRYLRINRLQRDFLPEKDENSPGYRSDTITPNFRQILLNRLKAKGKRCICIRCREVKDDENVNMDEMVIREMRYDASGGEEWFIEWVHPVTDTLGGFIRLRLPNREESKKHRLHTLRECALIRELHVYGRAHKVHQTNQSQAQHRGFGRKLVLRAEQIAQEHGWGKIAIISGVGVREYYQDLGYTLESTYMVKNLRRIEMVVPVHRDHNAIENRISLIVFLIGVFIAYIIYGIIHEIPLVMEAFELERMEINATRT